MTEGDESPGAAAMEDEIRRRIQPVFDWVLEERLHRSRLTLLFDRFCRKLRDIGLPVVRASLHMPQLHPQLRARSLTWDAEAGGAIEVGRSHGIELSESFVQSPIRVIYEGGAPIRRRLEDSDCPMDYPILRDLKAKALTDYWMGGLDFSTELINAVSFASDRPGGFGDRDIACIEAALPAFGMVLELRHAHRTARQLLDTYLGRRTGMRVLSGAIKRGDGERIDAVLWCCDLRGFTEISETRPLDAVIELLDRYFELTGSPVERHGGEILKFIGDAVLAIFPIEAAGEADACVAALAAADEALSGVAATRHPEADGAGPAIRCGVALHLGEAMYGNIGTAGRLDFTVIGPAVNLVTRLEALNRELDPPLVFSADFARHCGRGVRSLGVHALKGIAEPREVFTLEEEPETWR